MSTEKSVLASVIAQALGLDATDLATWVEYPPNANLGDLAFPCFRLAKIQKRSPQQIAEQLAKEIDGLGVFASAEAAGGYVNVRLHRDKVASDTIHLARTSTESLFSNRKMEGRVAAVDYSSPNIAKPFGVGHLRSTIIGQSIVRLLEADGCQVVGVNHLGDWGTQFGKNIAAYLRWGDEEVVKQNPVRELFHLYVRFHDEAKDNPELEDEGRLWFKRLEEGDETARHLWQWFIDESIAVFKQTYELLGVSFDHYLGESFYNDKMEAVVDELREEKLLVESEGAEVVNLSEWNMPPCIIKKSDGASIYATRDLAAALYRNQNFGADTLVYVVGAEQTLHFQQIFKVLELMGKPWAKNCKHVSFGMMKYNGERLSTRRGKVVYLDDVLRRAVDEAAKIIEAKNPSLPDRESVAKAVGVGAVIFNDLKTYRQHDVDFRYEDVLNFDGETGPYVQYTHARACSVLRKADGILSSETVTFGELTDVEWRLVSHLTQAHEYFDRAVAEFDPSLIARFALDLCQAFNRFYHDHPILSVDDDAVRLTRLALTDGTRAVLKWCLTVLGLTALEAM